MRLEPQVVVDLGCATGRGTRELAARYPQARVIALDSSAGMLRSASLSASATPRATVVGAAAEQLPLRGGTVQLLFANLVLPWCRPDALFAEAGRVLDAGGLLLFATLGPDSLEQVRRAWAAVDDQIHVHAAFDMHDLGDLALAAGLAEPVMDVDRLDVTYSDLTGLARDLRACGAINVAGGRRRSLTGAQRWRGFERRLVPATPGRFAVTVELIFGQAWGRRAPDRPSRGVEIGVPIERIGRRAENT
jgi:malonyl-CoA O-methyltransferase